MNWDAIGAIGEVVGVAARMSGYVSGVLPA